MDLLDALNVFIRVVETGSFSAVARETGTSHSVAIRKIGQLERHFGIRLLHRTTRRLGLTDDGQRLLGHALQLIDDTAAMERELAQHRTEPLGVVRLGAPIGPALFFTSRLMPLLRRHPGLSVDLIVYEKVCDMIASRLDLAIYYGKVPDASLIARQIGAFWRSVVAAPAYFKQYGTPNTPADLHGHVCILQDEGLGSGLWRFVGPEGSVTAPVSGPLSTNNEHAALRMARSGCGIACLPDIQVFDDVRSGRLVRLLADYECEPILMQIAYPSRRHLALKTRVVLDFVVGATHTGMQMTRLEENRAVPLVAAAA